MKVRRPISVGSQGGLKGVEEVITNNRRKGEEKMQQRTKILLGETHGKGEA